LAVQEVLCILTIPGVKLKVMALKVIEHGSHDYQLMLNLRDAILRKPLGLKFDPAELEKEKQNVLIGAFDDDEILGCCMLVEESPQKVRLRQMAVLNNLQGKGIGRAIMTFAENLARDRGYKILSMHARKNAAGFYEKMGYKIASNEFTEVTIPHFVMEKQL
jgi:GNAT superfamily N-acetyltransferase